MNEVSALDDQLQAAGREVADVLSELVRQADAGDHEPVLSPADVSGLMQVISRVPHCSHLVATPAQPTIVLLGPTSAAECSACYMDRKEVDQCNNCGATDVPVHRGVVQLDHRALFLMLCTPCARSELH